MAKTWKAAVLITKSSWGAASSFTWISAPALPPCSLLCWCDQLCSGAINPSGQKLPWFFSSPSYFLQSWALWPCSRGGCTGRWAKSSLSPQQSRQEAIGQGQMSAPGATSAGSATAGVCEPAAQIQPALCVHLRWKGASWTSAFPHSKSTFKTSLVCWLHDFICIFILILLCCGKIETLLCKNVWCVIVIYIFVYV